MIPLLSLIGGLVLLYYGAEGLVRGSAALALHFGVRPLVVGLTVVAFGTSSPELVVSLQAAMTHNGAIAVGNVVGSNICNIALILGLSALIRPMQVHAQLLRQDVPLMIFTSLLLVLLLANGFLGRLEGAVLFTGIVIYIALNIWMSRREHTRSRPDREEARSVSLRFYGRYGLFVVGGLTLLVFGADLMVDGAVALAERAGLSKAVIGLTIIALGTSLPELATSLVAAIRQEGDIAIGNVIGSNVFNILAILGISSLVVPLQAGGVGMVDLVVMTAFAVLMLPLMRTGFRLCRLEGALLLVLYTGYVYYLLP